jgi:hypothetical protein
MEDTPMLACLALGFVLLFHGLNATSPSRWIGDVFAPGDTVSYSLPHARLQAGAYVVTLADEAGKETEIEGEVDHGDLSFACPALPNGFYEIASARSMRNGKMHFGLIDGSQGFYIEHR